MVQIFSWNKVLSNQLNLKFSCLIFIIFIFILYFLESHNTPCLPPPPPQKKKKKNYLGIVFNFSWDIFMCQEKLQTMITIQNYLGVGDSKMCYGISEKLNSFGRSGSRVFMCTAASRDNFCSSYIQTTKWPNLAKEWLA